MVVTSVLENHRLVNGNGSLRTKTFNFHPTQPSFYSRGYNTPLEKITWKNVYRKSYHEQDTAPEEAAKN
jgi:hypothetical protein